MRHPAAHLTTFVLTTLLAAGCGSTGEPVATGSTQPGGDGPEAEGTVEATDAAPTTPPPDDATADEAPADGTPADGAGGAPGNDTLQPGEAVALGRSGELSGVGVIRTDDGTVLRELTTEVGQGASSLDWVPGRDVVLWSRVVTAARSEIVEMPLSGGQPRVLDVGDAVDATDDGDRLAVARRVMTEGGLETREVEVREGAEVLGTWTIGRGDDLPATPGHLALSADGTRLALDVRHEDGTSVLLVDLAQAPRQGALEDVARPVEPREDEGAMARRPFWVDGRLGVVLGCCGLPEHDEWTAVLVDAATGEVTDELVSLDRAVGTVDVAADGRGILLSTTHDVLGASAAPGPDVLLRWDGEGPPVEVAEGLVAAW